MPRGRPGRGRAVLGGERHARVVGAGWPAFCRPARGQVGDGGRVGDQGRLAFHDEIELPGRDAQRAAWVTSQVPALAGALAGLEPPAAVRPERTDAGDVRASVWVDRGQPAGVTVRAPGAGAWLRPARSRASIEAQSSSGEWYKSARLAASMTMERRGTPQLIAAGMARRTAASQLVPGAHWAPGRLSP